MRCLYCGKELALLKRLTGGAEFCSDAHRKRYQEEFNDLALSRLLQTQTPTPKPLPSLEITPEEPEVVSAAPVLAPAPPPEVPAPVPAAVRAINVPSKARQKDPEPADPVVGMTSYLIELPVTATGDPVVAGGEPPVLVALLPTLPQRGSLALAAPDIGLPWADPVSVKPVLKWASTSIRQRGGSLEIREFSRQATAPAVAPQQTLQTNRIAPASAFGEAMEIMNQPRPPANPPVIWQAGPQPLSAIELVLGDFARADFAVTGFGEDLPPETPQRVQRALSDVPQLPLPTPQAAVSIETWEAADPQPVEAPPPPAPVATAPPPAAAIVPDAVTEPLPITLHGVVAGSAQPVAIISTGVRAAIEPRVPASSALPLRPKMVLVPRPVVTPAPEVQSVAADRPTPAPVATPVPAVTASSSAVRPLRGANSKNRRPEVRVIQTSPAQPGPAKIAPAPVPATKPAVAPTPVATPKPTPVAQPAAAAKSPITPTKSSSVRSTLISADVANEPSRSASKPEVDLHLPELHNPEIAGPWARMPMAAKAGIGAVLALGIIGFAYSALNSSSASATTGAVNLGPAYNLGKQINSGGWIEDWAPAGSARRITLLRGSQPFSDYRIEFEAQIQKKAIGWMYRGLNPRNYYVVKLEALKPGIEPVVAMVRYAVIDGKNENRVEKILPMKVRVDTTYKIRFDAVGPNFSVWVQGQKIDDWRDTRLGSGGVGLYSEGDEIAEVHGTVNVFELVSTR